MDKKYLRSLIFRHLDGLVTAPVLSALAKKGALHYIVEHKTIQLEERISGKRRLSKCCFACIGFAEYVRIFGG